MYKIVIVSQRTRLDDLVRKYNTKEQAEFHITHSGADFSDYVEEDIRYKKALETVRCAADAVARTSVIDKCFLPTMRFGAGDVVIAVGRDGLVCNTMKYLDGQLLVGVNPDPARWDGILLPYEPEEMAGVLPLILSGNCIIKSVTLAQADTNDGQTMLAVNDFFIGPNSHISARYDLTSMDRSGNVITEYQSSSGIIVSTGIGQTGWYKSIVAQASAGFSLFDDENRGTYRPIAWDEEALSYAVREPYPSNTTKLSLVYGKLRRNAPFTVLSKMAEKGVIFSDGLEDDYIEFNAGTSVKIGIADRKGRLVRPD